jgi:hypothetical protein
MVSKARGGIRNDGRVWNGGREGSEMQGQRTSNDGYETICATTWLNHETMRRSQVQTYKEQWDNKTRTAGDGRAHNIPESFSAFCNIVSLTAANTSRILVVSVACVRL